jgi:hypothetical protein
MASIVKGHLLRVFRNAARNNATWSTSADDCRSSSVTVKKNVPPGTKLRRYWTISAVYPGFRVAACCHGTEIRSPDGATRNPGLISAFTSARDEKLRNPGFRFAASGLQERAAGALVPIPTLKIWNQDIGRSQNRTRCSRENARRSIRRSAQAASIGVWYRAGPPFEAVPFFASVGVARMERSSIRVSPCPPELHRYIPPSSPALTHPGFRRACHRRRFAPTVGSLRARKRFQAFNQPRSLRGL